MPAVASKPKPLKFLQRVKKNAIRKLNELNRNENNKKYKTIMTYESMNPTKTVEIKTDRPILLKKVLLESIKRRCLAEMAQHASDEAAAAAGSGAAAAVVVPAPADEKIDTNGTDDQFVVF